MGNEIQNDLTVAKADAAKIVADARTAAADVKGAESWLKTNWHYAVAIAVGFLFLGAALGMKIGEHVAK
jgi:hypothetical protein